MQLLSLLLALPLSTAFSPTFMPNGPIASSLPTSTSTSLSAFESEVGSQPPLGFWDPLNFLSGADQSRFDRLRYVELKHGRIAMLACLGHITVACGYTLPGVISSSAGKAFADVPNGFKGLEDMPREGLLQMLAFVGFLELFVMKDVAGTGEFPGDFRNGFLDFGWDKLSKEEQDKKRGIELNNGRAAQMGILGLMVHEQLNGEPYVINSLFGADGSPGVF
mmetsp:Transcript_7772/g.15508  ORF Transcript_7772/g.15508 Transcript_7772/m.15508 type:complete len:221 (+) Transcript_7772:130-792(+)|eukprot:CAMPEP_0182453102 /NCGR_PEP_ID=MMETSP1319-20130603/305_1 /TAXON_ID=172717 /ORGANISM="Bolidomonas pacifica, Strain RCC208" /LENGTH=220 /DNA_ID=CAMNT_0024650993 /DNA_START=271 /DNA_END=933 /DNA_ORIENTATION=-